MKGREDQTYVIQSSAMLRSLNNLNGRIVAYDSREVGRERYLRQTDAAVVQKIVGPRDAEHGLHDERVIQRDGAFAQVDVDEGVGVAVEPAWLHADGSTCYGPLGAVFGHGHAATWRGDDC